MSGNKFQISAYQREQGAATHAAIRECLKLYPGILNGEIAALLGIHSVTAGKHVRSIRAEWRDKLKIKLKPRFNQNDKWTEEIGEKNETETDK